MKQRQSELAYEALKADINLGVLTPGAEYSELELVAKYDMSRASVRAALTRLGEIHLVEPIPRRGFRIAPITAKSVRDLFDARSVVEPRAAFLATSRIDVRKLAAMNKPIPVGGTRKQRIEFLEANLAFHTTILEATGNQILISIGRSLLDANTRLINVGLFGGLGTPEFDIDPNLPETHHVKIVAAFKEKDGALAEQVTREHIEHAKGLAMHRIVSGEFDVV